MKRIEFENEDNQSKFLLYWDFDTKIIENFKNIFYPKTRAWNCLDRRWEVIATKETSIALKRFAYVHGFEISPETETVIEDFNKSTSIQIKKKNFGRNSNITDEQIEEVFQSLASLEKHPVGKFDEAHRYFLEYPNANISPPSRSNPYASMNGARRRRYVEWLASQSSSFEQLKKMAWAPDEYIKVGYFKGTPFFQRGPKYKTFTKSKHKK